ncbi:unnamed protein product [Urochloa decumbens]|uniref:Uncharacterized protein n=1 Tax=Urochloa decumbens TaxID=240449 RepID=A0ABC9B6L5_9POAL
MTFRAAQKQQAIIQKVPQSVRGLEERYFVPDVVAIGPYHRGAAHLAEMEPIKAAVAHDLCRSALESAGKSMPAAGESPSPAITRFLLDAVRPLVPETRLCYAGGLLELVADDSELAIMMAVDGCFLLAVMAILTRAYPDDLQHWSWTRGRMLRIMRDILLFENQVPWPVLRRLMDAAGIRVDMDTFVAKLLAYLDVHSREPRLGGGVPWQDLRPAHLLDLVHQRHLCGPGPGADRDGGGVRYCDYARPFARFTSAVELAEAGIRVQGSGTSRAGDVRVEPAAPGLGWLGLRIGRLALPQLTLSWLPRCWLVNMVALECVTDRADGRSGVSSYLAILASLIRAERDVEELRSRRILFSTMSDRRTVDFFEGLLDPLPRQELYLRTLEGIAELRRRRSTRSWLHGIYYRNMGIILAAVPVLILLSSVVGVVLNNSLQHH